MFFRSFNGSSEPDTPLYDDSIPSKPFRPQRVDPPSVYHRFWQALAGCFFRPVLRTLTRLRSLLPIRTPPPVLLKPARIPVVWTVGFPSLVQLVRFGYPFPLNCLLIVQADRTSRRRPCKLPRRRRKALCMIPRGEKLGFAAFVVELRRARHDVAVV